MHQQSRTFTRSEPLVVVGLICMIVALYGPVMHLWWTYDDFFHLRLISQSDNLDYWTVRFHEQLPFSMLTPNLFFSLELDYLLVGVNPRGFYIHQLISLALAAAACFCARHHRTRAPK